MLERIRHLPGVGQRIIRSVCAVFLCFVVYELRGKNGIPFYSALAALQCIQPYMESSTKMAKQRIGGTLVGAAWGLAVLLLMASNRNLQETLFNYALLSLVTGAVLYTTVLLGNKNASYFSCLNWYGNPDEFAPSSENQEKGCALYFRRGCGAAYKKQQADPI